MATSIENQPEPVVPPGVPVGPQGSPGQGAHVLLKDVGHLVRLNAVAVPSGFSKLGNPLLYLPQAIYLFHFRMNLKELIIQVEKYLTWFKEDGKKIFQTISQLL